MTKELYKESKNILDKALKKPINLSKTKQEVYLLLKKYDILWENYQFLQKIALEKKTIRYSELAKRFNLKTTGSWMGKFLGTILGILNLWEFIHNRPMISVLVVRSDTGKIGKPGKGFIEMAKLLGKYDKTIETEKNFIKSERISVFKTWG